MLTVQPDHDQLLELTSYGRVLLADADGTVRHVFGSVAAGPTAVAFLPDHSILLLSGDGILRSVDDTLTVRKQSFLGSGGLLIEPSWDGSTVIVGTSDFSVRAVDPVSLEPMQLVATRSPDMRLVHLAPDGSFVSRVLPGATSHAPEIERIGSAS